MLGPLASNKVLINYSPSALGESEKSSVTLSSNEIGTWEYVCSGVGLLPTVMPEAIMTGVMGGQGQTTLTWRNPFAESAEVRIFYLVQPSSYLGDPKAWSGLHE